MFSWPKTARVKWRMATSQCINEKLYKICAINYQNQPLLGPASDSSPSFALPLSSPSGRIHGEQDVCCRLWSIDGGADSHPAAKMSARVSGFTWRCWRITLIHFCRHYEKVSVLPVGFPCVERFASRVSEWIEWKVPFRAIWLSLQSHASSRMC